MIIDKYFPSLSNFSCHYVEQFEKIFYLNLKPSLKNPAVLYGHILMHCAMCMLISAQRRHRLPNKSGRLVSAQRRLMASVGSLPRYISITICFLTKSNTLNYCFNVVFLFHSLMVFCVPCYGRPFSPVSINTNDDVILELTYTQKVLSESDKPQKQDINNSLHCKYYLQYI